VYFFIDLFIDKLPDVLLSVVPRDVSTVKKALAPATHSFLHSCMGDLKVKGDV